MTQTIVAASSRNDLLKIAAGGLVTGLLTPLLPDLIDKIDGVPSMLRWVLIAIPFAVLVSIIVRGWSANPVWAALLAAVVTMIAFVGAVNTAIYIVDDAMAGVGKVVPSLLGGLAGGLVGSAQMALGIALLPAGPRKAARWIPMLVTGTAAGALLALDTGLALDKPSFLFPIWQAAVAVRLAMALRPAASLTPASSRP